MPLAKSLPPQRDGTFEVMRGTVPPEELEESHAKDMMQPCLDQRAALVPVDDPRGILEQIRQADGAAEGAWTHLHHLDHEVRDGLRFGVCLSHLHVGARGAARCR